MGALGAHVIDADQPEDIIEKSVMKRNVRHWPEEMNGPGIAVPQKDPGPAVGPLPVPLVLAICGEAVLGPSYTYNLSQLASRLNSVSYTHLTLPTSDLV